MSLKSILIVDDSPIIVERLALMLENLDNITEIGRAADYLSAISLLAESVPTVVLLDINLPGRNGISLLQFIKYTYPAVIVIMITNQAGDNYRKICNQMGADYFIDKSKDFEQIPSIISSLRPSF
ncbi:MAG TPA: response regulator transcription factor [Puia sp.]|jgi:DNA-binding NarL/FixJ family response regulator|nr:response regulator transcription factor [Puia sp.]